MIDSFNSISGNLSLISFIFKKIDIGVEKYYKEFQFLTIKEIAFFVGIVLTFYVTYYQKVLPTKNLTPKLVLFSVLS